MGGGGSLLHLLLLLCGSGMGRDELMACSLCGVPLFVCVAAGCWGYFLREVVDQSAPLLTVVIGNPGSHYAISMLIQCAAYVSTDGIGALAGAAMVAGPAALISPVLMYVFFRKRHDPCEDPGNCQNRGYNLTGNVSGRCPECGTRILGFKEDESTGGTSTRRR